MAKSFCPFNGWRLRTSVRMGLFVCAAFLILPCPAASQRAQPANEETLAANPGGKVNVEVELPELRISKKDKPLDGQVRVGLYLPSSLRPDLQAYSVRLETSKWRELFHRDMSLFEDQNIHLSAARVKISPTSGAAATLVTVHLSNPLSARLAQILRSLFPSTTVHASLPIPRFPTPGKSSSENQPARVDSALCPAGIGTPTDSENLQIQVEMLPRLVEREKPILVARTLHPMGKNPSIHVLERLDVEIRLTISDATQNTIETIDVVGAAKVDGFTVLPATSQWEDIGQEALLQASDKLVEGIRNSQKLRTCLKRFEEPRSLPAGLVIAAKLDDSGSLLPNGRLDAGEEALLAVHIENKGPGPAYRVGIQASSDRPEITVSGEDSLGDIDPGEKKDVVLRVTGGLGLSTGLARLRVAAIEKRGYGSRPVEIELGTSQILLPKLEIVDVTLNDRDGRAVGDGDGQPGNGESIEAIVRVRNSGPGDGAGVAVMMASPKVAIEILDSRVILPRIPAGRVEEARLLFRLPFTLEAQELPLSFQAVDARGAKAGSTILDQMWKIHAKRPGIVLGFPTGLPALSRACRPSLPAPAAGSRPGAIEALSRPELFERVVPAPAKRGRIARRGCRHRREHRSGWGRPPG